MDTITQDHGIFYTTSQLSENMETTPEGYLLCRNVPIARTGSLVYGPGEVPIAPGITGKIEVFRNDEDLFNADTVASFTGKPVTLRHPNGFVTSDTWKNLAKGTVQNPRRGSGEDRDWLMADLLVTDKEAIEQVLSKKLRGTSCGYKADYETLAPGKGRQRGMLGNHVALVERGRCGVGCAVRDEQTTEDKEMADEGKIAEAEKAGMEKGFLAAIKALFAGNKITTDGKPEGGGTNDSELKKTLDGIGKRLDDIETRLPAKQTADTATVPPAKTQATTMDAATVADLVASAGIIHPGYKPTPQATTDAATFKREVLSAALTADAAKATVVEAFVGKSPDFSKIEGATLDAAFIGVKEVLKMKNNSSTFKAIQSGAGRGTKDSTSEPGSQFDAKSKELWGGK